ncbi:hypothetical protein [Sulfuricella sp.]|uniref:hypothetical protein n=1 Tax=Sulfuricella sp. TaxID=2099377 RepID=UPI002CFCC017|nr:hypothetical protein [Sulfuricella sp.]HUX62228.1 hypothetical protein [Sulfuricella sp.]
MKHITFVFMLALAAPAAQAVVPQISPAKDSSATIAKPAEVPRPTIPALNQKPAHVPFVSANIAEAQRAEALRKEQRQLDAALARHSAKMKALEARAKPKKMP